MEKEIVATLGGGQAFLKEVLAARAKGALDTDPTIVKVAGRLPKDRVGVAFVSAENALRIVDRVTKALGEDGIPFPLAATSLPAAGALLSDSLGLHATIYVPMELAVSIKNLYNQAQQQKMGGPGAASRPATAPAPKPEF